MKIKTALLSALVLIVAIPLVAGDKHKKKQPDRGMLERMEAVPCGAKERGLTGLGSVFACVGGCPTCELGRKVMPSVFVSNRRNGVRDPSAGPQASHNSSRRP